MEARAIYHSFASRSLILGSVWAVLRLAFRRLARAPLTSTTLALVTAGYVWALVNALFLQPPSGEQPWVPGPAEQAAFERQLAAIVLPQLTAEPGPPDGIDPVPTQSVTAAAPLELPGPVVGNRDTFRVQTMLKALGLFEAEIDGYYGPVTATAIRAFEQSAGLTSTGAISPGLIEALEAAYMRAQIRQPISMVPPETVAAAAGSSQPTAVDPLAEIARSASHVPPASQPDPQREFVAAVQRGLASLGFLHGEIDGIAGEATARAIRNFEVFNNYPVTGEVTPDLIDMLQAANASL
jgi:peptidoglycan hydrolase-like protein with peptidoglycan-binding domain